MDKQPRLDRTAFHAGSQDETEQYHIRCQPMTYAERLRVAAYLNSVAFKYDQSNPPRLDRKIFNARRHEHHEGCEMCGS